MKRVINLLNVGLLAMCAYIWGYHAGMNQPRVDRGAIEEAVYLAMKEG